jgi:FHS family L-fucose permease-like MFS transporter
VFLLFAFIFKFSSIPNKIEMEPEVIGSPTDVSNVESASKKSSLGYTQLVLGMIGIFVYVGVEVSTASNLPEFMRQKLHTATGDIAPFISLYWASLMVGRWANSVGAFNVSETAKKVLAVIVPYLAFLLFLGVNKIFNRDVTPFYVYALVIVVMIISAMASKGNPARQLLIFSVMGITALCIGMFTSGMVSVFAFISVGLFCSTLWPCIYTLAIAGLGKHTNEGSSFLIMMIMGGGFISLLQGYLAADKFLGIQFSYLVGVACFAYLAFYAIKAKMVLKEQGIDFDAVEVKGAH